MSEFYIGWSEGTNDSKRFSKRFFLAFILLMVLIVGAFTLLERPFADSEFEYGNLSTIEGRLLEEPVISLRVKSGDEFEIIPLVGYGKMGPHQALSELLTRGPFHVSLEGTLIQYKGNKLFELTNGKAAVKEYRRIEEVKMEGRMGASMEVSGEIVDPKCFFGVMNPGYGKVHKSCAIRCISGQIPPILAIRNGNEFSDFYFLMNMEEGGVLGESLLKFVGSRVTVEGNTYQMDNWKSIDLRSLTIAYASNDVSHCGF